MIPAFVDLYLFLAKFSLGKIGKVTISQAEHSKFSFSLDANCVDFYIKSIYRK